MSPVKLKCHQVIEDVNKLSLIFEPNIFLTFGYFLKNNFTFCLSKRRAWVLVFLLHGMCVDRKGWKVTISWGLLCLLSYIVEDLYQVPGSHQQCWHWFLATQVHYYAFYHILNTLIFLQILAKKPIILGKWKIPPVDGIKLLF